MTKISKLEKRGIVDHTNVYQAWFNQGVLVGMRFTADQGWQGSCEGELISLYYNQVTVRMVKTHCGWRIAKEDYPKIGTAAKVTILNLVAHEAGYAANCGVMEDLVRVLRQLDATGQFVAQLDFSGSWPEISIKQKMVAIDVARKMMATDVVKA